MLIDGEATRKTQSQRISKGENEREKLYQYLTGFVYLIKTHQREFKFEVFLFDKKLKTFSKQTQHTKNENKNKNKYK